MIIKPLLRKSWSLSWPMTLIMFFVFLIGLSDVYVAGMLGKEIQAAYGVVFQLYFIFSIIAIAVSIGTVAVVSKLFTSADTGELNTAVGSSIVMAAAGGIVFSAAGILFSRGIISWLNIPAALKDFAVPLMAVYSFGLLFNYVLMNTNAVLRACGLIRKSLWTMGVVCFLNILLNFILAFKTPLGYLGIAVATCISIGFGSLMNIFYTRKLLSSRLVFSFATMKRIADIGWPAGLLQILWQLGAMVIFLILSVLPRHNIEIMAAFTNGLKIESAIFLPAFAFSMASAVVVGNLLGVKDKVNAFAAGLVTAGMGVIIVTALSVAVMLNARLIASFLSNNDIVIKESLRYIYISLIAEPVLAWGVILSGSLNGAGDTRSVMIIFGLSIWLVRIPLCYLLGVYFGLGVQAVWWSMNLSILAQAIFVSKRYFAKKWVEDLQK